MKKIILTLIFAVSMQFSFGQNEFAPIGAKWHYTPPYGNYDSFDCFLFESTHDTIINGNICKVIDITKCITQQLIGKEYLFQNGDSLFYYNYNSDNFYLLYNFSAEVNDTIIVHNNKFKPTIGYLSSDSIIYFKYKILEIDSLNISGEWYKRQTVTSLYGGDWGFSGAQQDTYIIEKMGSLVFFFGRLGYIIPEESAGILRCYSDSIFNYHNPDWEQDCDYSVSIKELNKKEENFIKIFPNPFNKTITIETSLYSKLEINILNLLGETLLKQKTQNNSNEIDLSFLLNGIYIIKFYHDNVFLKSEIIIKSKK